MATIYIRDQLGKEYITEQLKIASGTIVTQQMLEGTPQEGEYGYEKLQEEFDVENLNINSAPGMLLSSTVVNSITQYIERTIQSLIANNATDMLDKLGINKETLEITDRILGIIDSAVFKINSILKFIPTNVKTIPSSNSMTSALCTSLKDMYMAIWLNLQSQYYETINDALTNLPTAQEALKDSIVALQDLAISLINQQCIKYTGLTLVELKYKCQYLIDIYLKYKKKKEQARMGIDEVTKMDIEFNIAELKAQLKEELAICTDLVFNSFMILEIKDAIDNIVQLVNEFNNIDLESLANGLNNFSDFMDLLVEMGIENKSNIITLKDAIESDINAIRHNFKGLAAQLTAQALSSAASLAATAVHDVSINQTTTLIQNYSFDVDVETNTFIITFEQEPLSKHIIKNLTAALINAETSEHEKIFNANQVQQIMNLIDKGVFFKEDQELELDIFNIKIKFNIQGYNKNEVKRIEDERKAKEGEEQVMMLIDDYWDRQEQIQELRKQQEEYRLNNIMSEFELGVVTEEYTKDPTYEDLSRRPTLQLVHELYSILAEIFPLLKLVITLVSNYKINKAKVEENAQGNIWGMIRFLAKVKKLLQKIDTDNKNFYTVRTLKTYHFITNKIKVLDSSVTDMELNQEETMTLYNFLQENNLDTTEINKDLDTILYFDIEQINEQQEEYDQAIDSVIDTFGEDTSLFVQYPETKYNDGTLAGLDKVQKAGTEIYYSNSTLPVNPSQILIAYGHDLDVSF